MLGHLGGLAVAFRDAGRKDLGVTNDTRPAHDGGRGHEVPGSADRGGLYAAYGGARVAVLDAVTFALAAGLYALARVRETLPVPDRSTPRARTAEGLGHSPAYVGLLYVAQGFGSVLIGLVSGPLLRPLGERRFAACAAVQREHGAGLGSGRPRQHRPHSVQIPVRSQPRVVQPQFGRARRSRPNHVLRQRARTTPIPATTVKFAASTAPSRPCSANGASSPTPPVQGTTTPSVTDRMCPGSTPAFAPQW